MDIEILKNDYVLSKNKLNAFWNLMNSNDKENNILVKDLLDFNKIMDNKIDNYAFNLYKKLIISLINIIYLDLNIINKFINNRVDNNIVEIYDNIPNDIKEILNIDIENINEIYRNINNYELDTILFDLEDYCDCLNDLIEMFFEPDNWYKAREKYLNCDEGKLIYNIYIKYAKKSFC